MRTFGWIAGMLAAASAAAWAATGRWHALGTAAAYGLLALACRPERGAGVMMAAGWSPRGGTDFERMLEEELRRTEERLAELRREMRRERVRLAWWLAVTVAVGAAVMWRVVEWCLLFC